MEAIFSMGHFRVSSQSSAFSLTEKPEKVHSATIFEHPPDYNSSLHTLKYHAVGKCHRPKRSRAERQKVKNDLELQAEGHNFWP